MITVVQEKNKTVITIPWRVPKKDLERIIDFIDSQDKKPRKIVTKKTIQALAEETTEKAWERFTKERGISPLSKAD